ncbi:Tetratricopeptide repeat-containing protein [Chitinophaga sp. CF118]|uniref:tetratricopeptide repeat protein n=1 Tax=Chitinophaga sp. CF118 TaxID=1884367 RepID=UPI0008E01502|nr:tetratricopeptide repeat protein [Chitinophaga sp. CF118]SFE87063.1 Tetratricopeptide repeat-containing protein [Chitinophaga sp. CF118]
MLKNVLAFACLLLFSGVLYAQTAEELVEQALQQEKQMKESAALALYKDALKVQPDNIQALTGASELCSREGYRQKDTDEKIRNYDDAKNYADQALKLAPENADANYVMAVAMGRKAMIAGAKEKVAASKEVKKYAELAIKFNPSCAKAYHVLGKWNYEVANLNTFEKAAAKMLFGGLPEGSLSSAINNYEKCRKLDPFIVVNYLELARAYLENDEQAKAIEILKKAVSLRSVIQDDADTKSQCKKMLEGLE